MGGYGVYESENILPYGVGSTAAGVITIEALQMD